MPSASRRRKPNSEGESTAARPSLVDGAERALRNWLAPGRYRQGDRLPPEHEVAAMLGVSRGTLRSALQRLEESGEIVRRQGSGTFVGRMAVPTAFGERLERLEPYSSVAAPPRPGAVGRGPEDRAPGGRRRGRRGARPGPGRPATDGVAHAGGRRRAGGGDVRRGPPRHRHWPEARLRSALERGTDGARRADRHRRAGHLRAHAGDPGAADPARAGGQGCCGSGARPPGSSSRS